VASAKNLPPAGQVKLDETSASKLIKKSLYPLGKGLVFAGKPFYLFLSYSILALLLIANSLGYLSRISLTVFGRWFSKLFLILFKAASDFLPKISQIKIPRLRMAKLKDVLGKFRDRLVDKLAIHKESAGKSYQKVRVYLLKLLATTKAKIAKRAAPEIKLPEARALLTLLKLRVVLKTTALSRLKARVKLPVFKLRYLLVLLSLLFLVVTPTVFWRAVIHDLPSPKELISRSVDVSTKIYDRNGILLYKIYKDQNRTPVTLDQIPLHVRLATLAIEDAEFYNHPGFSVRGIIRASLINIRKGELTGGSTITQQLVKNALLTPEKTVARKLREVTLAIGVEFTFSKDQILEMYLNEVSYGGTAYGIQEASQVYFDKSVGELTLAEAALLAGLPKSPTRFSPFGPNPEAAFARQREVLNLMAINGYITEEQAEIAKKEKISFAPNKTSIKAPHFVMEVRQSLVEKYGEEVVEKGGLKVITTLDYRIQKMAEEVVAKEIAKLEKLNVGNGAALVINPSTGEILAMVGSKDYFDTASDGNVNITQSLRQPGSSIKVVNYAYALSNDYTAATILSDTPVTFSVQGQPPYTPTNYDGKYRGKLPLRSALAESRNIPAVKVLASYGVANMLEMGQKLGITSWGDPSNYGLSLTLGGGDVKLTELARVYATIANYGRRPNLVSISKVTNFKGKVLEENDCQEIIQKEKVDKLAARLVANAIASEVRAENVEAASSICQGEQVLDPRVAFLLIDILRDNVARTPAFGSNSLLVIPNHPEVAVKTGTSNNLRDNLTIGFTQKYLVAVWVGNNDNSPMSRIASGITGAAPIFNEIMSRLLAKEENHPWEPPAKLVQVPICPLTGTLPCEGYPTRLEWFLEENVPKKSCERQQIIKIEEEKKKTEIRVPQKEGQILEPAFRTER
jgi:1A family penicillin-binding protein